MRIADLSVATGVLEAFWESLESPAIVLHHPQFSGVQTEALGTWLPSRPELRDHLLFRTSGTEGLAKYVALSKRALRFSAERVNAHLRVRPTDRWLGALPRFHVGGYGIELRARLAQIDVCWLEEKWDPIAYARLAETSAATLTSLVPTQVHDLVERGLPSPQRLRAVLVGGGALSEMLWEAAAQLGWPLLGTYGMTETASQVATQALETAGERAVWLEVLPDWSVRLDADGTLLVRGDGLFSGYVRASDDGWQWDPMAPGGWHRTHDRVRLDENRLAFLSRESMMLKINGELVNLLPLRHRLEEVARGLGLDPLNSTVVPLEDARAGERLILVVSGGQPEAQRLFEAYNEQSPSIERVGKIACVKALPRSALGKLREAELRRLIAEQ